MTSNRNSSRLIANSQAVVEQTIQPGQPGRVMFRASWWPALCERNVVLAPNEVVRVIGRKNITLLVEPMPQNA